VKKPSSHPAKLCESPSMAFTPLPELKFTPDFPPMMRKFLSGAQMEAISYAFQKHQELLPNGHRAGFFIGE